MALIKCPECGKEFSDKASACPNCGCPISEIRKQTEEEKQKNIFELKLEGSYSLKYDGRNIEIYNSGIFVFSAPKEEFVLNYGKEETDYGREQLKVVFSHKGYGEPFIICVNKTSERYTDSKKFLESIAEKYFVKDIQDDYFRAGAYAKNHVYKNIEQENKRNLEKIKSAQVEATPENKTHTSTVNQVPYSEPKKKKRGCCGAIAWIFIIFIIISAIYGRSESDKENPKDVSDAHVEESVDTNNGGEATSGAKEPINLDAEVSQFESGGYAYITNQDLNMYAVNMSGVKVYIVTQVDDIKDGRIQSTLDDGFMMSDFYVGDNYEKYSNSLSENDTVAIAGTVSEINDYSFVGKSVQLNDCIVFAVGNDALSYKKDATDESLSQYLVVTEQVANLGESKISEADYKALCTSLNYEEILRNPDSYDGKYCVVSGTVDQVIEGWFGSFTIFVVDGNGNKWGCTYSYDDGESRLLEGDGVTMYGKCLGVSNTKTVLGEQVTLPHIEIEYIN